MEKCNIPARKRAPDELLREAKLMITPTSDIPQPKPLGYMRIGELAKKTGINTNTLRYYDKEGLLTPSAESEGGYRLYTDKDLVKLMQIQMMKQLRFPLSEIKKRIVTMDTTAEVLEVLTEHATTIRKKIEHMTESLSALESLKEEIVQLDSVDFKKFAVILEHLLMKNERYWLLKYLDNDILDILKQHVTGKNVAGFIELDNLSVEAAKLQEEGIAPESEEGQNFAAKFWKTLMEITGGDMPMMYKIGEQLEKSKSDEKHDQTMDKSRQFMTLALKIHFDNNSMIAEAARLYDHGVPPESEQGQDFAERCWDWVMGVTGGDANMMQKMNEQYEKSKTDEKYGETVRKARLFMASTLEIYFERLEKI